MSRSESLMLPGTRAAAPATRGESLGRRSFMELKGLADFVVALLLFLLTLPVLIVAGLAVLLTSRGPVFYVQRRVGKHGEIFRMLKLRTMVKDAELMTGPVWARADDPRCTPVGRFLRKTHLDELPQLLNVLKGDMALVGPRPERPVFVRIFNDSIPRYYRRHSVKPGITGLAQVHYKYDETIDDVRRKLAFDLLYIRRMCWMVDFTILWLTLGRVVRSETR